MKDITSYYTKKNILFKNFNEVPLKKLYSRKKVRIYTATTLASAYYSIFVFEGKSRFVKKSAYELLELFEKLVLYKNHNFKYKEVFIKSPLCSKAKSFLKDEKWRVRVDFM